MTLGLQSEAYKTLKKLVFQYKIVKKRTVNRGSNMSAHVLLNLLNKLGKKNRCEALPSILLVFPNKCSNTGARMQDSIYHMMLKSHFISNICTKTSRFRP